MSSHHLNPQLEALGPLSIIRTNSQKHKTTVESLTSQNTKSPSGHINHENVLHAPFQKNRKTMPNQLLTSELRKLSQVAKPEIQTALARSPKDEKYELIRASPIREAVEYEKIDNFAIAKLLEEARQKDSLANILKIENNSALKLENNISPIEKELSNKVFDKIQKTFQKKEVNSPTFMPSVRQSNGNKLRQVGTAGKNITSPQLKINQRNPTIGSPAQKRGLITEINNYKNSATFGLLSSRNDKKLLSDSSFSPLKSARVQNQLPEMKVSNSGYKILNNFNDKSGWNSERTPLSSQLITQRASPVPPANAFNAFNNEIKKPANFRKRESSRRMKMTVEDREKLNKIIQKDATNGFDEIAKGLTLSTESSVGKSYDGRVASKDEGLKNDLNAAIAEYQNDFHSRFAKNKRRGQMSDISWNNPVSPKFDLTEKKWANELPHRRAFAISNGSNGMESVPDFMDQFQEMKKSNFSLRNKLKPESKNPVSVKENPQRQKNRKKTDAELLEDKFSEEKLKFKRIRQALRDKLLKCGELKVSIKDIVKDQSIFPKNPYEKEGAEEFIKAAKLGDYNYVYKILKMNRYFVFEYDPAKRTALHWAAKRGNKDVCRLLLDFNADPEAQNLGGRTPLYYALKGKHSEIVRLILCAKADPWRVGKINYKTLCKDTRSNIYLTKARQINLLLKFQSPSERQGIWEKEIRHQLAPILSFDEDQS